jgi:hypothetical protein
MLPKRGVPAPRSHAANSLEESALYDCDPRIQQSLADAVALLRADF